MLQDAEPCNKQTSSRSSDFHTYTSFCPGNQCTCPRREKAKVEAARLEEVEDQDVEEMELLKEQHELVRGEKPDSWRCLSSFWYNDIDYLYIKYISSKYIPNIYYLCIKVLELLEGAENGRYKVVAKAEPYKNLPVRVNIALFI